MMSEGGTRVNANTRIWAAAETCPGAEVQPNRCEGVTGGGSASSAAEIRARAINTSCSSGFRR